ncbi:tetratricopeptide repeat 28-like isoform X1 [Paramuricea clavata]|uniref:Tetratricopeptide repeat 28-like isoform X1 n=1 Tax=Paramuricea clavata TaxID=317549 RepID=A0A6S7GCU5_PARCT|nr:tetratricopeptide repeat 28-like isoform X1 [Paramuricea clavata]
MALQIEKPSNRELSLERSKLATHACQRGAFDEAALLYTEAISLDPNNHVLYTNRSAVYLKTKQYDLALEDGKKAAELKPNWQKAVKEAFCGSSTFNYCVVFVIRSIRI